jgi:hypothetical protein
MKRLITFWVIPLLFAGCEIFEDNDKRTYFDIEGMGYVYYEQTKAPAQNVRVTVRSNFKSREWATKPAIDEDFYTDGTGFLRIKFLKRTQREDVVGITVNAYDDINSLSSKLISCTIENLDDFILKLDTLWILKH